MPSPELAVSKIAWSDLHVRHLHHSVPHGPPGSGAIGSDHKDARDPWCRALTTSFDFLLWFFEALVSLQDCSCFHRCSNSWFCMKEANKTSNWPYRLRFDGHVLIILTMHSQRNSWAENSWSMLSHGCASICFNHNPATRGTFQQPLSLRFSFCSFLSWRRPGHQQSEPVWSSLASLRTAFAGSLGETKSSLSLHLTLKQHLLADS